MNKSGGLKPVTDKSKVPDVLEQVSYGSTDLSLAAIKYRKQFKISPSRNVAVFEYKDVDGLVQMLALESTPGRHAEPRIAEALIDKGVKPDQVTRIYSELEPCTYKFGPQCKAFLAINFPKAEVSYSFEYGDKDSMIRGIKELKQAAEKVLKEG